jgi:hypothetical protein
MEYVREQRERIREVKMLQILKRALTLDARSKIKPTLKNPSLLRMSELRTGAGIQEERFRPVMPRGTIFGGGLTEDIKKSADLFAKAQEQRQNEFNKSLLEAAASATAAKHPELVK